ncbi:MAG: L-seryl-tRNA(Sec) selenium transferase [Phycisphaerae bacterium]
MSAKKQDTLASLPAVGTLLERDDVKAWIEPYSRPAVVGALRDAIGALRQQVLTRRPPGKVTLESVLAEARRLLTIRQRPSLKKVVNATGIVLHTGLGRAPLSAAAVQAIADTAAGYTNLEFDLDTGKRGKRQVHVAELLARLTGAESATVVNNNAAATLLILNTLAKGRQVVVSRGQLVEIGGSFRLPDIMSASGAVLREVGTTNRTRIADYADAIDEDTAALMRVHTSNYRVVGFTEDASIDQLVELAHRHDLPVIDDLGSGALLDFSQFDLPPEPGVCASIGAGVDLVCFSGDKLLGGPQCGIICGQAQWIRRLEANPLMRTYRVGKLTLLALEATLREYVDPERAAQRIPTLALLCLDEDTLAARAELLCECLSKALPDENFIVCSDVSYAGGGSLPANALETVVVQWRPATLSVDQAIARLRAAHTPVIARIREDAVLFDLHTFDESEFEAVKSALEFALEG